MSEREIDIDLIDEAVLALTFLTLRRDPHWDPHWRAWKSFDWDAMGRLYDKDLIFDPVGKAKSLVLTEQGRRRCEEACYQLFAKRGDQAATGN